MMQTKKQRLKNVVSQSLRVETTSLTKFEIGNIFEDIETNILHSLTMKLDM
jgi:hypothetical protein